MEKPAVVLQIRGTPENHLEGEAMGERGGVGRREKSQEDWSTKKRKRALTLRRTSEWLCHELVQSCCYEPCENL